MSSRFGPIVVGYKCKGPHEQVRDRSFYLFPGQTPRDSPLFLSFPFPFDSLSARITRRFFPPGESSRSGETFSVHAISSRNTYARGEAEGDGGEIRTIDAGKAFFTRRGGDLAIFIPRTFYVSIRFAVAGKHINTTELWQLNYAGVHFKERYEVALRRPP